MPNSDPQTGKRKASPGLESIPQRQKKDDTPQDASQKTKLEEAKEEYSIATNYVQRWCRQYEDWFQKKAKDEEKIKACLHAAANNSEFTNKLKDALQELEQISAKDYSIQRLVDLIMSWDRIHSRNKLSSVLNYRDRAKDIKTKLEESGKHDKLGVKALPVLKHQVDLE